MNEEITVYSKTTCPFCVKLKEWLKSKNIKYNSIVLDNNSDRNDFYKKYNNSFSTVPQLFVGNKRIGGYTEVMKSDWAKSIESGNFNSDF